MLGSLSSPVIDFCIGMLFFFFIITMICTMINEYFMDKVGKLRQKNLLEGISGLFYDAQKVLDFYKHPLVTGLYRDEEAKIAEIKELPKKDKPYTPGNDKLTDCMAAFKNILGKLPSYIPSRTFAAALLDLLPNEEQKGKGFQNVEDLRKVVTNCGNDKIKGALLPLINAAGNDVEKAQRNIERWFDDTMDRVGGWFKRHARGWLLVIGFVVCVLLNADTFMVGKILWQDPERLAALVTAAQKQANKGKEVPNENKDLDKLRAEINKKTSQLPIGWVWEDWEELWKKKPEKEELGKKEPEKKEPEKKEPGKKDPRGVPVEIKYKEDGSRKISFDLYKIIFKVIGLISTTLAISLGAPFWTDLLNTFVNLRRGGKKPAPTAEESKQ